MGRGVIESSADYVAYGAQEPQVANQDEHTIRSRLRCALSERLDKLAPVSPQYRRHADSTSSRCTSHLDPELRNEQAPDVTRERYQPETTSQSVPHVMPEEEYWHDAGMQPWPQDTHMGSDQGAVTIPNSLEWWNGGEPRTKPPVGEGPFGEETPSLFSTDWDPTTWDSKEPPHEVPDRDLEFDDSEYEPIPIDRVGPYEGPTKGDSVRSEPPGRYGEWIIRGRALGDLAVVDEPIRVFMTRHGIPNIALAATDSSGRLCLSRGYTLSGIADVETYPDSMFRLASLTKTLTAIGVLWLSDQGAFPRGLDTPANRYVADLGCPMNWMFTIRELLAHVSGICTAYSRDVSFKAAAAYNSNRLPVPRDDVIRYLFEVLGEPLRTGGIRWIYNGHNYIILGRIIEVITGLSYFDFIEQLMGSIGATSTRRARSRKEDKYISEVTYFTRDRRAPCDVGYASPVTYGVLGLSFPPCIPFPYGGIDLDVLSSSGGLVSSTHDLLNPDLAGSQGSTESLGGQRAAAC